ncbi:lactate dehydrogenase-like 2-hydroxyacid dehydrogenase [Sulfuritortus calidifontis]|uniref:Lactate dehydrogenase-like 2-hydroxyacid dehydrogenase n=1 Tax=Sulfuritortus calidifontis TaxID=1914471 RepID=A0A4R3JXF9_9PROT|nr:D-glycerate dehydrogenase [Sulfuritortus calidifontis]TCS71693.1 lactate dehydrogenase-like 2-hydroxyacid dehydrogenase [Sulfuritortus calidifontis]
MKPKILVTREVFDDVLGFLGEHFEVEANQGDAPFSADALAQRLAGKAGALTSIVDRIDGALLDRCPDLKAVCNIAVGYNNFDLAACTAHGVMATNTPGVLDDSTADFTWALILAAARRVTEAERYLRAGQWTGWKLKQFLGTDVHHATLGILGMGRIGQKVARRALGFDMPVLYHNRSRLPEAQERALNARYVSLDELLAQADILTVHTPYSPQTHHLVGAAEFARMKPGVVFIHASRGGVVDDAALVAALRSGRIGAAGLDVYEGEPRLDAELLKFDNVVLTPHIASSSEATRRNMAWLAARNLVAALRGEAPPNLLNPEVRG